MSDDQQGMDDLIARAAAQAEAEAAAEQEPSADAIEDAGPSIPEDTAGDDAGELGAAPAAEMDDDVDWEALADLDERSRGELLAELSSAAVARDGYLEALQRKQAEFDNFRKRMQRDASGARISGHADVAGRLLDVLDDFDRVIDNAGDVDQTFLKGITLVHDKLFEVLGGFQLSRIDEAGVVFDPNRHEAVQQVPADEPVDEPRVAEVYRPGYEMAGRVLRAAMVVVKQ